MNVYTQQNHYILLAYSSPVTASEKFGNGSLCVIASAGDIRHWLQGGVHYTCRPRAGYAEFAPDLDMGLLG